MTNISSVTPTTVTPISSYNNASFSASSEKNHLEKNSGASTSKETANAQNLIMTLDEVEQLAHQFFKKGKVDTKGLGELSQKIIQTMPSPQQEKALALLLEILDKNISAMTPKQLKAFFTSVNISAADIYKKDVKSHASLSNADLKSEAEDIAAYKKLMQEYEAMTPAQRKEVDADMVKIYKDILARAKAMGPEQLLDRWNDLIGALIGSPNQVGSAIPETRRLATDSELEKVFAEILSYPAAMPKKSDSKLKSGAKFLTGAFATGGLNYGAGTFAAKLIEILLRRPALTTSGHGPWAVPIEAFSSFIDALTDVFRNKFLASDNPFIRFWGKFGMDVIDNFGVGALAILLTYLTGGYSLKDALLTMGLGRVGGFITDTMFNIFMHYKNIEHTWFGRFFGPGSEPAARYILRVLTGRLTLSPGLNYMTSTSDDPVQDALSVGIYGLIAETVKAGQSFAAVYMNKWQEGLYADSDSEFVDASDKLEISPKKTDEVIQMSEITQRPDSPTYIKNVLPPAALAKLSTVIEIGEEEDDEEFVDASNEKPVASKTLPIPLSEMRVEALTKRYNHYKNQQLTASFGPQDSPLTQRETRIDMHHF